MAAAFLGERLGSTLLCPVLPRLTVRFLSVQPLLEEGETWKECKLVQQVRTEVRRAVRPSARYSLSPASSLVGLLSEFS